MRYAIATNSTKQQVTDYLPRNYVVMHQDPNGQGVLIVGMDDAGWTLDEYVIPRLASGLIVCREVYPLFAERTDFNDLSMDVPSDWLHPRGDLS